MFHSRGFAAVAAILLFLSFAVSAQTSGKNPVIIVPGLQGSELIDSSGKHLWFSLKRSKTDDIRLPVNSPILSRNRDSNRVGDIIRKVDIKFFPDVEVYQAVIEALEAKGYTEATWNKPRATDVFYVFPYDWRRDNVESARLLIRRMAAVRRTLKRPNLKFDILAHSMGGLVARYAAMYGAADLPAAGAAPTWAGARYINKLMMFGTPNQGSMSAFDALVNGAPIAANRKLPLVDDFRAEDVFAQQSIYQLLPHPGSARFFDENMQPLAVDLYNPATWDKYGWGALNDPKFLSKLKDAPKLALKNKDVKPKPLASDASLDDRLLARTTYAQARAYFAAALARGKRFAAALDAPVKKAPIELYAFGGNCAQTLDGAVLIRDEKDGKWTTVLDGKEIKAKDGKVFKKDEVRAAIYSPGDGRVTQQSLLAASQKMTDGKAEFVDAVFPMTSYVFSCGSHFKLFLEKPIQDSFLSALVIRKTIQP